MELRTIYIEQIPVPQGHPAQHAAIETLVRKLLHAEGQGLQVAEWKWELNVLVYELHGLAEEEIGIVESQD